MTTPTRAEAVERALRDIDALIPPHDDPMRRALLRLRAALALPADAAPRAADLSVRDAARALVRDADAHVLTEVDGSPVQHSVQNRLIEDVRAALDALKGDAAKGGE